MIVAHQIFDFENDKKAEVYTWAVKVGKSGAQKWLKCSLVLMLVYILAPVFVFASGLALGLAISLVLLIFSSVAITYSFDALRNG